MSQDRLYFDHAASAPLAPEARRFFLERLAEERSGQNSSSLHREGRRAHSLLEEARRRLAEALGIQARDLYFCSGGTEANNWVLQGFCRRQRQRGRRPVLFYSASEHQSVRQTARALETEGLVAEELPLGADGLVDLAYLEELLLRYSGPDWARLCSVHWANNETGQIQPLAALRDCCQRCDCLLHSDAVAALGELDLGPVLEQLDFFTAAGHKFGGPIGLGLLAMDEERAEQLSPLIYGGAQERGRRAGTQNAELAMATALALEARLAVLSDRQKQTLALREQLLLGLASLEARGRCRVLDLEPVLASHLLLLTPLEGEQALRQLDRLGLAVSSGSACQAGQSEPSHVLLALGYSHQEAQQGIRICLDPSVHGPSAVERLLEGLERVLG